MDLKIQGRIEEMISSDHLIIALNRALLRDPKIITMEEGSHSGWMDVKGANLPFWLVEVMNRQFNIDDIRKSKDLLIKRLNDDSGFRTNFLISLEEVQRRIRSDFDERAAFDIGGRKLNLDAMKARASQNELDKQQILTNAPLYGHNLAAGGHPVFADIPGGYDIDETFCVAAGKMFTSLFGTERKLDFTVPALSSQGMTLKTSRDTPQHRIYSKAIMATIAKKVKSRKQYDSVVKELDSPFIERGFDGVTNDFYLGMRRQGMRKPEPVSSLYDYDNNRDYSVGLTSAIQGRSRGIFPPSEFLKIYFKPFAEGIKSSLFTKCHSTRVDMSFISAKVHLLAALTARDELITDDGEALPFYDLSAMDTTTHRGFLDSYHAFCRGVFPDFDKIEGDTVASSRLYFPAVVSSKDYFVQEIGGRSTLSGQPDVTTKNNICHILAMAWCLSKVVSCDPLDVFKHLCTGQGTIPTIGVVHTHIHGDDTMMYIGSDKSLYYKYYEYLEQLGFATSFEKAPIFLKKTVILDSIDGDHRSCSDIETAFANAANGVSCVVMSDNHKANFISVVSNFLRDQGCTIDEDSYNFKFNAYLQPVVGSLVKNRFGEYATTEPILLLMGLSDTACLMAQSVTEAVIDYWHLLFESSIDGETGYPVVDSLKGLDSKIFFASIQSDQVRSDIRKEIIDVASGSLTKALSIRNALERLYYAGGESLNDEVIDTIFGSLFVTADKLEETFDLRSMSLRQLVELQKTQQSFILDTNGQAPGIDEEIFAKANSILKDIGSY